MGVIENLLADTADKSGSSVGTIIIMGVLVLAIIGMFIWSSFSNKKKKKEAEEKVSKLKIGDRVKTIGGVCGFIAELNDAENTFVLRTGMAGKESFVKFDKAAIYQTAPANAVKEETKVETAKQPSTKKTNKKDSVKKESEEKAQVESEPVVETKIESEPTVEIKEENKQ